MPTDPRPCKLAGYRKFIVAVLFWASATCLCVAGKMTGG